MTGVALLRVATPIRRYHSSEEHLGIAYLAAYLRSRGAACLLLDMPAMALGADEALRTLEAAAPSIVGLTVDYANEDESGRFAARVRRALPGAWIVAGGHHAGLAGADLLLRRADLDAVALGEGERTLLELHEARTAGRPISSVPGLIVREGGAARPTAEPGAALDVGGLPHPARDALAVQISRGGQRAARVISARGCPGRCSFCTSPAFFAAQGGGTWRPRPPEDVVGEIEALVFELGVQLVIFSEDNSLGWGRQGHERFLRIAALLGERRVRVKFRIMGRVDNFTDTPEDEAFLRRLKAAGLQRVYLGFDGASAKTLATYEKNVRVHRIFETKALLDRMNVSIGVGFINFQPYSSLEELEVNRRFLAETGFGINFDHYASALELYPGVKIIERLVRDGLAGSVDPSTGLMAYRFNDERLTELLAFVERLRDELFEIDGFAWRLLHMKQNLREWLDEIGEPESVYAPHRAWVAACARALTECHASAVRDYLTLAAGGWDPEKAEQRARTQLQEAGAAVSRCRPALLELGSTLDRLRAPGVYGQREIVKWLVAALMGHAERALGPLP